MMRFETLAVHAGHAPDATTGAVAPAIHPSTTFERASDGAYPHGYVYARLGNPNRRALEAALAALEGGGEAAAFASGSAATLAVFQALRPGDHVVAPVDAYHGTTVLLHEALEPWGLDVDYVDLARPGALDAALRPATRLVWLETPSNPLLRITDIRRAVDAAHAAGARVACDNTWATPVLQRPLDLGADLVVHSTTKYLNGHGDVLGGVVIARSDDDELFAAVRRIQAGGGAVPSPFDCWLALRGLRTLPYRMRAHSDNAAAVARFLAQHAAVERVHYPGLETHPGHEAAARQMAAFGGMLSVQIDGGRERALDVTAKARLFTRATSLGGVESLIEHRASIEGPGTTTPENLLRLSIGLEHAEDLVADLEQALR